MVAVSDMKCACGKCVCVVKVNKAVEKAGKYYCSAECAEHHPHGKGCGHKGCNCK